jgi:hypothetical protein
MRHSSVVCLTGLVMLSDAALAQSYTVAADHQARVYYTYSTNPDCTSFGQVIVRLTQAPQHGRVTIRNATVYPNFPASNIRSVCNRRRVPGVEAHYIPERGYTGPDSVSFETIFPDGLYRQSTATISVR